MAEPFAVEPVRSLCERLDRTAPGDAVTVRNLWATLAERGEEIERLTDDLQDCQSRAFQERHTLKAEIEQLRAEQIALRDERLRWRTDNECLTVDNDRLRAALEPFADIAAAYDDCAGDYMVSRGNRMTAIHVCDLRQARAALGDAEQSARQETTKDAPDHNRKP